MRLIDAGNAKASLDWTLIGDAADAACRVIDNVPTVDAVEVVRCKDCKHRYSDSWCEYVDDDDNFYCARGERKEGAD